MLLNVPIFGHISLNLQLPSIDLGCFLDMEFNGLEFTWSRGNARVRLDRFLCNSHWDESFPESRVDHLLRVRSDHRPILLEIGALSRSYHPPPF
ncbi:hypothetical protein V6N13_054037 [Hibiscus sabdariffa]